jgi:type 1 fimbria pilin
MQRQRLSGGSVKKQKLIITAGFIKGNIMRNQHVRPVALLALSLITPLAQANWDVEGANGVLRINGALSEGACRLDMVSQYQEITLPAVPTSQLQRPGDRTAPVAFQLRLRDCLRSHGGSRDDRSGNLIWAAHQPTLSVSFLAPADADNPQLVQVQGTSGIGLRLTDDLQRDARLGSRGAPLFVAHGDDTLTWHVAAERTTAPLVAGAYRATVDFHLNYD